MISRALFLWEIRRLRWWYAGLSLFFLSGLAIVLLRLSSNNEVVHWENHPFLTFGMIWALFWGVGLFSRPLQEGNMMEFLLARPVSRRELFNTLVLAWGAPLIILMISPFIYAFMLSPWFASYLPLYQQAGADFLGAALVLAIYMSGIFLGLVSAGATARIRRFLQAFVIAFMVAVFINLDKSFGPYLHWLMQSHPWFLLAASLSLAYLFYLLGLRRLERMDI